MATAELENRKGADAQHTHFYDHIPNWRQFDEETYQCRAVVWPTERGGFAARALRLPEVSSEGETIDDALSNVVEAFQNAMAKYLDEGQPIPWSDGDDVVPHNAMERILLVTIPRNDVSGTPSNEELRRLAKRHGPPQAWLDSEEDDLL